MHVIVSILELSTPEIVLIVYCRPASAGVASGQSFFLVQFSGTDQINKLTQSSNVGQKGVYIYSVDGPLTTNLDSTQGT